MAFDGYNLLAWRAKNRMSLAEASQMLSISTFCLWSLENGTSNPSWRVLEQIILVTGLPYWAFSTYPDPETGMCYPKEYPEE